MTDTYAMLRELLAAGLPFVSVTIVEGVGSIPATVGAKMLVTSAGLAAGTVGGGKLERRAVEEATAMLGGTIPEAYRLVSWNLQNDIKMTCGGAVKLFFERVNRPAWEIVVFGAGHVAQSLVRLLTTLDCHVTCFDPRADWLAKMPASPRLAIERCDDLPSKVAALRDDAFVLMITSGHSTDTPVLEQILRAGRPFPYVGVIGSAAKRATIKRELLSRGLPETCMDGVRCPMGLPIGTNQPAEIAVSIVAELIQVRDARVP